MPDPDTPKDLVVAAVSGDVLERLDPGVQLTEAQLQIIRNHSALHEMLSGPKSLRPDTAVAVWLERGAMIESAPATVEPRQEIEITGRQLLGATRVYLGADPVLDFCVVDDTKIRLVVPEAFADAGRVEVVTPAGHARSTYLVRPTASADLGAGQASDKTSTPRAAKRA